MSTILSLGSVNADFLARADAPPSGPGSMLATDLLRTSGGKAANAAVLAARLGSPVTLLGCVGDDDLAVQALAGPERAGVDIARVRRRPGPTGCASIVVPPDGAKSIVLVLNANDAWADEADAVRRDVTEAPDGSVLVVDLEVPAPLVVAALRAARERGFGTVLDPAPAERVDDHLLGLVDHVTPDAAEARTLTGLDTSTPDGAARAAAQLRERGAGVAHVKLGSGGCVTATTDGLVLLEAPHDITVEDATGAGDAFAGALAWALLGGRGTIDAAELAVAASTCAVTAYGSQESYPTLPDLERMATRVRRRQL